MEGLSLKYVDFSSGEGDGAFDKGEEGMVAADADVFAGFEGGAALTNNDRTDFDLLAAKSFEAPVLRVAVATVT